MPCLIACFLAIDARACDDGHRHRLVLYDRVAARDGGSGSRGS